jgi:hypothetical protein
LGASFAGFAFGTKYSAAVIVLAGFLIIFSHLRREKVKNIIVKLFRYTFWVVIVSIPWLVKNVVATGNPVFPFIFPTEFMDGIRLAFYQNREAWGGWQDIILLPLRATLIGIEGAPGYNATIGPILLAFGGLFWLGWRKFLQNQKNTIVNALWIIVTALAIWVIGSRFTEYLIQTRLYFTTFPAITVLVAAGFESVKQYTIPKLRIELIAKVMILLVMILLLSQMWTETISKGSLHRLAGLQTDSRYQKENLGFYTIAMESVLKNAEIKSVIMLWEPRSLYCYQKCDPDEVLDQWWRAVRQWKQPEIILNQWRVKGYTHLLLYRHGADFVQDEDKRYYPSDWATLENLIEKLPPPVLFGDAYELYRLKP